MVYLGQVKPFYAITWQKGIPRDGRHGGFLHIFSYARLGLLSLHEDRKQQVKPLANVVGRYTGHDCLPKPLMQKHGNPPFCCQKFGMEQREHYTTPRGARFFQRGLLHAVGFRARKRDRHKKRISLNKFFLWKYPEFTMAHDHLEGRKRLRRRAFLPASVGRLPSFWMAKRGKWWNLCRRSAATDEGGRGKGTFCPSAAKRERIAEWDG